MKRRLHFVLPDRRSANQIERELLLARVEPSRMGFLAKSAAALGDLPPASPLQKSDLGLGIRDGLLSGAAVGAVIGLFLYLTGQAMLGAMLVMALVGAAFGSWAASLVAVSVPNRQLKPIEKDLRDGRLLLVVDVPHERVKEVKRLVASQLPQVAVRGADPRAAAYCA